MKIILFSALLVFGMFFGFSLNNTYGEISANSAFSLEGGGFVVSEDIIQTSQLDLFFSTDKKTGSSTKFVVDDGFITLNDEDFLVEEISGTVLRDGKFLRIQGTLENTIDGEASISFFGRLIETSADGAVYSFTGRFTQDNNSNKVIYTSKISNFEKIIEVSTPIETTESDSIDTNEVVVHILKGSADPSARTYQEALSTGGLDVRYGYYSIDRIIIEPGTTVTFVNDDIVSHSVTSGAGLGQASRHTSTSEFGKDFACEGDTSRERDEGASYYQNKNCSFIIDNRVRSGDIAPGEKFSITIDELGFYRIVDIDYPWMNVVIYAFPFESDSVSLIAGTNDVRN